MTTPRVTEVRLALEPVSPDSFIEYLEETVDRDGGAPLRPVVVAAEALHHEN
jgi:hypothetical protein